MPTVIEIQDAADPRLRDYVSLREASLRRLLETEQGLFIAEGEKVIRRAMAQRYRPRSFLLAPRWLPGLADLIPEGVPVYLVTEAIAEAVSGFHVHRGALASMAREARFTEAELLRLDRLVVCEDLVDHTNVGAIVRNAAGLGWDGLLFSPGSADPLYRRAIKTSMGTVFTLPWARLADGKGAVDRMRAAGLTVVAMALREDAVDLAELAARPPARIALLVGTEGAGLSAGWIDAADIVVRIPMGHGVDSLNVGAAAAIACYALGPAAGGPRP